MTPFISLINLGQFIVMDHYPSHVLFMFGFSMEMPLGMAFLKASLNEINLTDVNIALCLVFSIIGIYIICVGGIMYPRGKKKDGC